MQVLEASRGLWLSLYHSQLLCCNLWQSALFLFSWAVTLLGQDFALCWLGSILQRRVSLKALGSWQPLQAWNKDLHSGSGTCCKDEFTAKTTLGNGEESSINSLISWVMFWQKCSAHVASKSSYSLSAQPCSRAEKYWSWCFRWKEMCVHVCDTQMHSPVFLKCKVSGGLLGRFYIRCRGEAAQAFGGAVRIKFLLCK